MRARAILTSMLLVASLSAAGCFREATSPSSSDLLDARDGHSYPVIRLGDRVWMARNLKYVAQSSWCYGDDLATCAAEGRLYAWQAARRSCPAGWRLPNDDDWLTLITPFGGHYVLKEQQMIGDASKSYIALLEGGTSGFSARLSGGRDTLPHGRSEDLGEDGMYWSESNRGPDSVSLFVFNRRHGRILRDEWKADFAASVRCILGQ